MGGRRPRQRHHTMFGVVRDEDLVVVSAHGDAPKMEAQPAHTRHGRRVKHAQDGAVYGQHLYAILVSDHQHSSTRYRHGLGGRKLPRIRASRSQLLPYSTVAQAPQHQPIVAVIDHHDHGALLRKTHQKSKQKIGK